VESTRKQRWQCRARPGWLGGLLAALGFGGIVFALIQSTSVPAGVSVAALMGLSYWETRAASPMVPFHLFQSANFRGANLLALFLCAALSGVLVFFPLNLIQVQGIRQQRRGPLYCRSYS
jgi:hypothetical protein